MFVELDLLSLTLKETVWITFSFLCLLLVLAGHMFLKQYGNYRVAKTLTEEGEWARSAHHYYFWHLLVATCHLVTVFALLVAASTVVSEGMYGLIGYEGRAVFLVIGWSAYGFHFLAREKAEGVRIAEQNHNGDRNREEE